MSKSPGQHHESHRLLSPGTCRVLTLGLLFVFGGCTTKDTPTPQNLPSEEQKVNARANLSPTKEAHSVSEVITKSSPHKETPPTTAPPPPVMGNDDTLAKGKLLYREHCANCHGIKGDGHGPLAVDLSTKPQNFTKGEYKFRSTMSGELPTDEDLFRTISEGIAGTAMESYQDLPQSDRRALVAYLKSLSLRFLKSSQGTPIIFPVARPPTPESVTHGRKLYDDMQCSACHGPSGRGDGELAQELTDNSGKAIQPADLTRNRLKSGEGPKAIYRTIMTGLDGTPMPSYGYSLDPEEGWDLALYIYSLSYKKEH